MEKKDKVIRVSYKGGHLATPDQLNALVDVTRGSRMDESWFGEIVEAVNKKGEKVHVVRDLERNRWLSLKFAVGVVNGGISNVRDYTDDPVVVDAYYDLLDYLGIEDGWMSNRLSSWAARIASRSRVAITNFMIKIGNEDHHYHRFRPMDVRRQGKTNAYYLDLGSTGKWGRSLCRWLCHERGVAYDVCFWGPDRECHHIVHNGKKVIVSEMCEKMPMFMKAEDIIEGKLPKKGKRK